MKIQEYFEASGFASVNFDLFGVGLSDPNNTWNQGYLPAYVVAREMAYVMRHCDKFAVAVRRVRRRWSQMDSGEGQHGGDRDHRIHDSLPRPAQRPAQPRRISPTTL